MFLGSTGYRWGKYALARSLACQTWTKSKRLFGVPSKTCTGDYNDFPLLKRKTRNFILKNKPFQQRFLSESRSFFEKVGRGVPDKYSARWLAPSAQGRCRWSRGWPTRLHSREVQIFPLLLFCRELLKRYFNQGFKTRSSGIFNNLEEYRIRRYWFKARPIRDEDFCQPLLWGWLPFFEGTVIFSQNDFFFKKDIFPAHAENLSYFIPASF